MPKVEFEYTHADGSLRDLQSKKRKGELAQIQSISVEVTHSYPTIVCL